MSGISSADAVRRMMNSCEKPEDIACRKLTKRIDKMILEQGQRGETCLQFQIPVFVWAVPAYDSAKVADAVAETYADKGFVVRITNVLEFEISWRDPNMEDSDQSDESETENSENTNTKCSEQSESRHGKRERIAESESESEEESDRTSESEEESSKSIVLSSASSSAAKSAKSSRVAQFAGLRRLTSES